MLNEMIIISKKTIVDFYTAHNESRVALCDWYRKTLKAQWNNFAQLNNTFRTADYVGNTRVVFNISGGHFRIVAIVLFQVKRVFIRFIGTHNDYDNIKDIENI